MIINFELLKVDKMNILKIFISPVMEKLETSNLDRRKNLKFEPHLKSSLDTLPQEVVSSLPHNHVTLRNLFISGYRGATVTKFE